MDEIRLQHEQQQSNLETVRQYIAAANAFDWKMANSFWDHDEATDENWQIGHEAFALDSRLVELRKRAFTVINRLTEIRDHLFKTFNYNVSSYVEDQEKGIDAGFYTLGQQKMMETENMQVEIMSIVADHYRVIAHTHISRVNSQSGLAYRYMATRNFYFVNSKLVYDVYLPDLMSILIQMTTNLTDQKDTTKEVEDYIMSLKNLGLID